MGNVIQIKRGAGKPSNGTLANGELGFDTTNKYLYIGNSSKNTIPVKVEEANSAIALSTTLPIDKGGTNATTVSDARNNLILFEKLEEKQFTTSSHDTFAVNVGGTGHKLVGIWLTGFSLEEESNPLASMIIIPWSQIPVRNDDFTKKNYRLISASVDGMTKKVRIAKNNANTDQLYIQYADSTCKIYVYGIL